MPEDYTRGRNIAIIAVVILLIVLLIVLIVVSVNNNDDDNNNNQERLRKEAENLSLATVETDNHNHFSNTSDDSLLSEMNKEENSIAAKGDAKNKYHNKDGTNKRSHSDSISDLRSVSSDFSHSDSTSW